MNIRQCYVVLELPMRSPLDEVKLSYKDLVQVWHPDRFVHSPRLRQKAEDKLQQLNEAYDILKAHLERQSVQGAYYHGTASSGSAGSGSAGYGSTDYSSTGYAAASRAAAGDRASSQGHASPRRAAGETASRARPSAAQAGKAAPSFFDSGNSYSWKWQLKAAAVIIAMMGILLVPVGLAVVIAQHPVLVMLLLLLPLGAYGYRVWVTR